MADVKILISAKDEASRVLSQVQNNLAKTTSIISSVGGAFGLAASVSVGALVAMAKSTVDGLDALNDLRDATGSSIENLSALEDVAARTGTSFETVGGALTKFNKALQIADKGSPTEAALKAIGLSVQELKNLDPAEALLKTAVALDGYATDGNKARLVSVLFGKSLAEVAPLLNALAEKGRLNATVTAEQALEAEKLNKEFFSLGKNATDLARSIAGPLVSALNRTIELFRQGAKESKTWRETMADAQWQMVRGWLNMPNGPKEYSARLAEISKELQNNNLHASKRAQLLREQAALESKLAADPDYSASNGRSSARLLRNGSGEKASVGNIPDTQKPVTPKAEQIDESRRSLGSYVEALQKTIDGTDKLTEIQKAQRFLASLGNLGEISQVRELVNGLAERIDKEKELAEARKQSIASINKSASENEDIAKENQSLAERIGLIGQTREGVNALTLARMDDAIAQEQEMADNMAMNEASTEELALIRQKIKLMQQQRALTAGGQIAQAAADTAQEQADASKKFSDELQADVKGALSSAFRDTKDPIGAFGDALGNVVFTRISNALIDAAATSLFGKVGSGGGLLGGLFSFDGGGYTGSGVRTGGIDGKGGFMAVMHPNESVIDHTKGQRAGQAVTVVQNFTVGDVASISMVRQAVSTSQRQIVAAFARSQNYGGAIA